MDTGQSQNRCCDSDADALDVDARFRLANALAASGKDEDGERAKTLYLQIIDEIPDSLGAWVNLGILLFETGYIRAAVTAFSAALAYHPGEAAAHVYLGNVQMYRNELAEAEKSYLSALQLNENFPEAHQGLASIYQRQGCWHKAALHRRLGFEDRAVSHLSCRAQGTPVPLLVLASARDGNIPWRLLIDRDVFDTTIVAVEYFDGALPVHRIVFNAIGDADLCRDELEKAALLLEKTAAPVINHPKAVLETGRMDIARKKIPKVITPRIELVPKSDFRVGKTGFAKFPYLLRSPGFHGGNFFVRVENRRELATALDMLPGEALLAIEFLDARSRDGLYRKYRVMCIGGALYPVHMAISAHWNVHYFDSDMDKNAQYRKEESFFLNDFSACLGADAISALQHIGRTLSLDYCGIDFGMDRQGNILLYEANATMVINPPTHEERWNYRRTAINGALAAARNLFTDRAGITPSASRR